MGNCFATLNAADKRGQRISDYLPPRSISFHSYRSFEERHHSYNIGIWYKPRNWVRMTSEEKACWEFSKDTAYWSINLKYYAAKEANFPPRPVMQDYLAKYKN